MNIHHLELFYYVALHGGVSAAVRHMPYGIQQPAVSGQIRMLEQDLGVKLFDRQPFRLTAEGEELLAFAKPFFENVEAVGARLGQRAGVQIRVGGSEWVLRNYLPEVIRRVKRQHPGLRMSMRTGFQPQMEALLRENELDLAISTALHGRSAPGLRRIPVVRVPLVLQVHKSSRLKSAAELWARGRIEEPLVSSVPAPDTIFQKGLKRLGVKWHPSVEATSLELVTWYVAHGQGIGVNMALPELSRHPQVRVLPLEGFDPVEIIAICRAEPSAVVRAVIEEGQRFARTRWPELACADEPAGTLL
jgi:DNA-binding transcriptional LysR family regulator